MQEVLNGQSHSYLFIYLLVHLLFIFVSPRRIAGLEVGWQDIEITLSVCLCMCVFNQSHGNWAGQIRNVNVFSQSHCVGQVQPLSILPWKNGG